MKRIRFIYGAMLLVLALAMNACDDYYSVAVAGDPGVTPVVLTTPEESITLPAKDAAGEVEIVTNMENSTISIAVPADAKSWCSAALSGNKIAVTLVDNPRTIARSTILTVKVFSITCKIEVVQEAKTPEPIYPIEGTYKFNIPSVSDFDATKIYKVMDGNLKVAEICLEYLKNDNIASRAVVVYTGEGGAADYTRGFVAYLVDDEGNVSEAIENGGTASFDYEENTLDYVAGTSEAVHTVYLSSYGITKKEPEEAVKETVPEPYLVSDMEGNSYPVVKIGSEVWLGSNLRTTKYSDGTEIPLVPLASLDKSVACCTYPNGSASIDAALYGYLYTSKVVAQEDLLAGSIVDGMWRISTGGGTNAAGLMGNATDWQRLFKYIGKDQLGTLLVSGYTWDNGGAGEFDINSISNLTGLSIVAAGQIYNGTSVWRYSRQAFFFYGNAGRGYNLSEKDAKAVDQAGVREWPHANDACSIRLVRVDNRQ